MLVCVERTVGELRDGMPKIDVMEGALDSEVGEVGRHRRIAVSLPHAVKQFRATCSATRSGA